MLKIHIEMRTLVQLFTASSSSGHVPKNIKPASAVSLEGAGNSNKSEKNGIISRNRFIFPDEWDFITESFVMSSQNPRQRLIL